MNPARSVAFDVDGTLVDSERDGHRVAFNQAFDEAGLPDRWSPELYGRLLQVTGGRRRIERYLVARGWSAPDATELAKKLHTRKNDFLTTMIHDGLISARPGVQTLLTSLEDLDTDLHVVTTGSRTWVLPLLDGLFGPGRFRFIIAGDDVSRLKPHPEAYRKLLAQTGQSSHDVVAVEDSAQGVAAATGAGLRCIVVTNDYTVDHATAGAAHVVTDFNELDVNQLLGAGKGVTGGLS